MSQESTLPIKPRQGSSAMGPRRFSIGKQILFSVIIVGGLLLVAEGAVRIWALYFRTSYERYNAQTGRLELKPGIAYTDNYGLEFRINSKGFVGPEFDDQPVSGVYRIMAVGDSCTFGTGRWKVSYPGVLQQLLDERSKPRRFEVINAGIEGYNSTYALDRVRDELLRYRPNLMVVYVGWNDLMKTDPSGEARVDEYRWLAQWLDSSYLVKAYKKLLFVHARPLILPPATEPRGGDATVFQHYRPGRYQANLESMITLLRQHDVKVLIVTLPTVVRPGMTREDLRNAHVFFPYFPGAYGVSSFLSLHHAYNNTIVSVARQKNVELLDLAEVFDSLADPRPYFWDTMHPSAEGHAVIARALFARITTLEAGGRL